MWCQNDKWDHDGKETNSVEYQYEDLKLRQCLNTNCIHHEAHRQGRVKQKRALPTLVVVGRVIKDQKALCHCCRKIDADGKVSQPAKHCVPT